jgi:hypothetical protein
MWLPDTSTNINFPVIPTFDKESIAALIAWYAYKKKTGVKVFEFSQNKPALYIILLYLVAPLITTLLNQDPIFFSWGLILPPETFYNRIAVSLDQFIILIPILLGMKVFKTFEDHVSLFKMIVVAGLVYSILILWEIRAGPSLHIQIYGYFPFADFTQNFRAGGFRAVVFMRHGLLVAIFLASTVIAAAALWKIKIAATRRFSPFMSWAYLLVIMVLQKSSASLLYSILATALIKFTTPKLVSKISVIFSYIFLAYPILSLLGLFPHEGILHFLGNFQSTDRLDSLAFRFTNETLVLDHAKDKMFFGWGGFGRGRIYLEEPPLGYGITDGGWIIQLAQSGIVGFLGQYGLIVLAILNTAKAIKSELPDEEKQLLAAHAFLCAIILMDQIPNDTLNSWVWILVGSLIGRCNYIISTKQKVVTK